MDRPNILYIMCDQFRFDCISALGNRIFYGSVRISRGRIPWAVWEMNGYARPIWTGWQKEVLLIRMHIPLVRSAFRQDMLSGREGNLTI